MTHDERVIELREQLEFAPPATPVQRGLLGWQEHDTAVIVCARCASRILGRGFSLRRGSEALWHSDHGMLPELRCDVCEQGFEGVVLLWK
jgi:hypothetical protein